MSFAYESFPTRISREQLPLLQVVRSAYSSTTLEDAYVICAQHLLGTSAVLFHNLFQIGLDPNHFSVIGKCYSTDPAVYFNLKNIRGLDVCCSSRQFFSDRSFDSQYAENIQQFLEQRVEKILASGCRRLIIVDDGGELIQAVNQLVKNGIFLPILEVIGVEQTSSGFAKLQAVELTFPVVNVARSNVKLHLESSIIADAIIQNLWVAFEEINVRPTRALVFGRGAIGSKVENKLGIYCPVDSFDPAKDGCSIQYFKDIDFKRYNLIVGCSGKEIMSFSDLCLLKKQTILASGSSSDREFHGATFRVQLNEKLQGHEHICTHGIYLLNCGFPANFSNHYDLVDDDRYQLTRSLLLTGILQAYSHTNLSDHFIDLNPFVQHAISERFFSLYPSFSREESSEDVRGILPVPAHFLRKQYKSKK